MGTCLAKGIIHVTLRCQNLCCVYELLKLTIDVDPFTVNEKKELDEWMVVYSKCKASNKKMVNNSDDSAAPQPTYHIIREVYDSGNAHESFEAELDKALEAKVDYIIIEPTRLGDETSRWITVGNCLHKTAVVSGLASIISGILWQDRPIFSAPMCAVSVFCTGLYTVSWNYDPCCQYQVESDSVKLSKLPLADVSSPVVLEYSENTKTKYFHRGVTLLSAAFCAWQIYKAYK